MPDSVALCNARYTHFRRGHAGAPLKIRGADRGKRKRPVIPNEFTDSPSYCYRAQVLSTSARKVLIVLGETAPLLRVSNPVSAASYRARASWTPRAVRHIRSDESAVGRLLTVITNINITTDISGSIYH